MTLAESHSTALDALAIAAHPDDAEISLGGTLLELKRRGLRIGIIDLTSGEMGTRGDRAERAAEAEAANRVLQLDVRENLGLPDGRVQVSVEAREALAHLLRVHQPQVVFAHHTEDLHPDHCAAGTLARQAWYLSGLARLAQQTGGGLARRPRAIYHFMGHVPFEPTFVVDIGAVWEAKVRLIECYETQLTSSGPKDDGRHFLFGSDILERVRSKARYWGESIGAIYGEPLLHHGPLPFSDPLLGAAARGGGE